MVLQCTGKNKKSFDCSGKQAVRLCVNIRAYWYFTDLHVILIFCVTGGEVESLGKN